MSRYAIWNKKDNIITPVGEVLTPEQWIDRYPVAGIEGISVVCSAGEINGGIFGTLGQVVQDYEERGADFTACQTDEDKLAVIEAFDKAQEEAAAEASANATQTEEMNAASLASIAASMEYQNLLTLEDTEV